jgi:hypothetical protein
VRVAPAQYDQPAAVQLAPAAAVGPEGRCILANVSPNRGYGESPDPTLPTLPQPPEAEVLAAMRAVPDYLAADVFAAVRLRDNGEPLHFLLVAVMERGHSEPAAQWAIHRLVTMGLLVVTGDRQAMVTPTDALWQWWREQADDPQPAVSDTSDVLSFDDIRKLLAVDLKTVQNAASEWRGAGHSISNPCSYALIRPLLLDKWPKKTALFPESWADLQRILDARK